MTSVFKMRKNLRILQKF